MPYAKSYKRTRGTGTRSRKPAYSRPKKSPYSVSTGTFKIRRKRANIAAVVKSVLQKQSETKENTASWSNNSVLNVAEYVSGNNMYAYRNLFNIIPGGTTATTGAALMNITQGTGQANRSGNMIQPNYCKLDMMFFPKPYNETTNIDPVPCEVIIWIVKPKITLQGKSVADVYSDVTTNGLFQFGNSDVPMTGEMDDTMLRINEDQYQLLYKRRVKVGNQFVNQGIGAADGYSNNDFKMNQRVKINLTKYMPKRLKWDDTGTSATSRPIYVLIERVRADNLPVTNATSFSDTIGFTGVLTLKYKDY